MSTFVAVPHVSPRVIRGYTRAMVVSFDVGWRLWGVETVRSWRRRDVVPNLRGGGRTSSVLAQSGATGIPNAETRISITKWTRTSRSSPQEAHISPATPKQNCANNQIRRLFAIFSVAFTSFSCIITTCSASNPSRLPTHAGPHSVNHFALLVSCLHPRCFPPPLPPHRTRNCS